MKARKAFTLAEVLVATLIFTMIRAILTPRECEIICMRYALDGNIPLAQREVAAKLRISRSYVSRIEKKALEKLRCGLKREDFTE